LTRQARNLGRHDAPPVKDRVEHRLRVPLRWRDMDQLGHLNQAVYHELLAEARIGLLTDIAHRSGNAALGDAWVVVRVELDYRAEVRKDHGEVDIVVGVGRTGTSSLRLDYEILLPDATVAASGSTVVVAWDPVTRRKRGISESEREALEP
jgi:acyl-CoA thioester hydrolase